MVDVIKTRVKVKNARTRWLFFTTSIGILMLLIPMSFLFMDPLLLLIRYGLRLANGTILHGLMLDRVEGPRIYLTLFNFTNAQDYVNGKAEKMNFEEVGPFVFQEYRINQDLVIDEKTNLMVYTPKLWAEFIPQESIADPKDVYVTMPSISMLQGADMISKYPYLVRSMFNIISSSIHSKAIVNITAQDFLWGYHEPLIKLANTAVPGLFTTIPVVSWSDVKKFTNAYEGAAFPPGMTAETPVTIFRHGVCKTFKFQYKGTKTTEYGSEAFTYDFANDTLNDHKLCLENGKWCPDGLLNLAPCYFNFPFALSRGHFLGADPRILERCEGFKPDEKLHSTEIVIDPKIGVTLNSSVSVQLNLALGDIGFNAETRRFKDTVLPVCLAKLKHPKLPSIATTAFLLLYTYKPYIILVTSTLFLLLGILLLVYSAKIWYRSKVALGRTMVYETQLDKNLINDAYFRLIK